MRKKKPRVMWKRQREVRIVVPDMRPMVAVGGCLLASCCGSSGDVWSGSQLPLLNFVGGVTL